MRARVAAGVFIAVVAAFPAIADNTFRPRLTLSWETRDFGGGETSRLREDIELFLSRNLTDTISMQIGIDANHYSVASEAGGRELPDNRALELRPFGALEGHLGGVQIRTDYSLRRTQFDAGDWSSERNDDQITARMEWASGRFYPGAMLRASSHHLTDDASTMLITSDSVAAELDYGWRGLELSVGQALRTDRDTGRGYERRANDLTGSLNFAHQYFGGRLNVTGSGSASKYHLEDQVDGASRIPVRIPVSRAFRSYDDTPLDGFDQPLVAVPALIDSRIDVSAGIDLGPDGASFLNIAFDIGRVSPVDEIQLIVRDERLEPVVNPAGIRWDVYTSPDGQRWTLHVSGADTVFDSLRSQLDISFEQVDVRWIKLVTFGVTARPVLVTEAVVLFHQLTDAASESDFTALTYSASLSYMPHRTVTIAYTGTSYETEQETGSSLRSDVQDSSDQFSARWEPTRRLGYEARYELRRAQTDRLEQVTELWGGSIRFLPLERLVTTLTCEVRNETFEEIPTTGTLCSVQVNARVYPTLDVTIGGSQRDQELLTGGTLFTQNLYSSATAQLSRTLRMTLTAALNRNTSEGEIELPPPGRDDRYTAEIDWVRGRALALGGTFGWASGDTVSGLIQRYRVRWSPFGDGAVSLGVSYAHDIDTQTDSRSRRLLLSPRWQINPGAALNLTWVNVSTTGSQAYESDSILAALVLGR